MIIAGQRTRLAVEVAVRTGGRIKNERRFLLSLVAGALEWSLLGIAHLEHLLGIRWKLHNLTQLQKTNAKKFAERADKLATRLASTTLPTTGEA